MPQDKSLQMNQTIETAILQLQQSPTPEQLAHTDRRPPLYAGRRAVDRGRRACPRWRAGAARVVTTADGASWWYAFTSFEEQMKSPDTVKSTFLADIDKLFAAALSAPEIAGIIVNPWHCTLQLDKELIRIIQPGRAG